MFVCTDSLEFATEVLAPALASRLQPDPVLDPDLEPLTQALLRCDGPCYGGTERGPVWQHLLLAGNPEESQCHRLLALARAGRDIPDRTVCVSRTGQRFRGFKGRSWAAVPGNLHLAVHFAPGRAIERFEVAFTVLAAVSVVDAIDDIPGLAHRTGIRWVNDIVVDDVKLGGVLAYTQTRERIVTSAVLGIGLNVEATPAVRPTPFVPAVGSLRDLTSGRAPVTQRDVLESLLWALDRNYVLLLQAGYVPLLERYRRRSTILGRHCTVCTDESDTDPDIIAAGRIVAIGHGLELYLEGRDRPIDRGRLFLRRPESGAG